MASVSSFHLRALLGLTLCAAVSCGGDREAQKAEHLRQGNQYFEAHKYREAIVEYKNVLRLDDKSGEARRGLAEAYEKAGDRGNAYKETLRAADLLPNDVPVQLAAGKMRLRSRQFEDARATADRVLAKDAKNVQALLLRAHAVAGIADVDTAIKDAEDAIQLEPAASDLYVNLGVLNLQSDRRAEAEKAFRQAVQVDPSSASAHAALGNFLWSIGRNKEAEASFRRVLEIEPANPLANRTLALFYLTTGRVAEAEKPLKVIADGAKDVSGRIRLADYYLLSNRRDEAVKLLNAVSKEEGGRAPAQTRLAAAEYAAGRREEAHRILDTLLATEPNSAVALQVKAKFLFYENRLDEAATAAAAAAKANPESAAAFYLLGQVHFSQKKYSQAIDDFNEILRLNPRAAAAQLQLSRIQLAIGEPQAAVSHAQQAVNTRPGAPNARLTLARSLLNTRDFAKAEPELNALAKSFPNSAPIQAALGDLYLLQENFDDARRAFDRARQLDPASTEGLTGLIALDLVGKKPQAARARIDAAVAASPRNAAVLMVAATTYQALGDTSKTEEMLTRAVQIDGSNLQAFMSLGQHYYRSGRIAEGKAAFEKVLAQDPRSAGAQTMLGILVSREGKEDEARRWYEKALESNPRAAVAANNLAWLYVKRNEKLDVALQLAQTAKSVMPDDPEINDTLGWVFVQKGLPSLAIPPLEQSVQSRPGNAVGLYHLGIAYMRAGNDLKAQKALEQALALNPKFDGADDARKAIASLQARSTS